MATVKILIEHRTGRKPSPNELTAETPLCWNMADGILWGLRLTNAGLKQVYPVAGAQAGNSAAMAAGLTDVYAIDHPQYPLEYLYKVRGGQTQLITELAKPNGILFGGQVTWLELLQFLISNVVYSIAGQIYQLPALGSPAILTVTLDEADPDLPRIDIICVDNTPQLVVIKGVPSANPQKPTPSTDQLELTQVLVPAGATTPGGGTIISELLYDENIPPPAEWAVTGQGVVVNPDSTAQPLHLNKCIDVGAIGSGDTITFTRSTPVGIADFDNLSLNLKLKASAAKQYSMTVQLLLSGAAVSREVTLPFDTGLLNYQTLVLPLATMGITSTTVDGMRLKWYKSGSQTDHQGFYLDFIKLEAGIAPPVSAEYSGWYFDAMTINGLVRTLIGNGQNAYFRAKTGSRLSLQRFSDIALGNVLEFDFDDTGLQGKDGDTPYIGPNGNWWIAGVDTGTKAAGEDGDDGVGLPPGGTTGQVPKKRSNADYDIVWADENNGTVSTLDDITFEYRDADSGDNIYVLRLKSTYAFTINAVTLVVNLGTFAGIAVKINNVAVTGLSSITATTTRVTTNASGLNTVGIGDIVTIELTGARSSATKLIGELHITR